MFEPGDRNELERRIVTVLFCDLAGFTTLSRAARPGLECLRLLVADGVADSSELAEVSELSARLGV